MQDLRVNGDRLAKPYGDGSIWINGERGCVVAATELDGKARNLFVNWCKACGCTVSVDKMGNIFARREGKNNSLPAVATGSHLYSTNWW